METVREKTAEEAERRQKRDEDPCGVAAGSAEKISKLVAALFNSHG